MYHTLEGHLGSRSLWCVFRSFRGGRRRMHVCWRRWHRRPCRTWCGSCNRDPPCVEGCRCRSPGVSSRRTADDFETRWWYRCQRTAISRRIQVSWQPTVTRTRQTRCGIATGPVSRRRAQGLTSMDFRCTETTAAWTKTRLRKKKPLYLLSITEFLENLKSMQFSI